MKNLFPIIAMSLFVSCGSETPLDQQRRGDQQTDFLVQFIEATYPSSQAEGGRLIFDMHLSWDQSCWRGRDKFLQAAQEQNHLVFEAANDFLEKNMARGHFFSLGDLPLHYVLLDCQCALLHDPPSSSGIEVLRRMDWARDLPDSTAMTLSVPGFSSDGSVAVVSSALNSAFSAGDDRVQVFVKSSGEWKESEWQLECGEGT